MIFQYNLLLILCGFTALSVSTETCGKDLLEGTSCIIKLPEKYNGKSNHIKWVHFSSDAVIERKNKKTKSNTPGLTVEKDGSLRFQSVSLKDMGTYIYTVTSSDGTEIGKDEAEIKVYEKVPKPTVKISCTADGNAALTCDVENSKDPSLTVSWCKDGKLIQNEINPQVFLSSTQVQEYKTYSFSTETCGKDLLVGTSCIIKLPEKYNDKSNYIKWTHSSSDAIIERRNKKTKSNTPGLTMEEDGSLRFQSVSLKDTGTYIYTVTSSDGTEIGKGEAEIKVYGGNLVHDYDSEDYSFTDYYNVYDYGVDSGVNSGIDSGVDSGVNSGVDSGVDFDSPSWIMVSILAGGGALLLLLI